MTLSIRPYAAVDRDACRQLWVELTEHHRAIYDDPTIGGDQPGPYFDAHLARVGPERIWVAEVDGLVCGLVGVILTGEEAEVEPLIVAAAYRGQGVGQRLVARVRQEAEALQVRFLSVRPMARNVEAIAFFHQSGFRLLGGVELFMDLASPTTRTWKDGVTLHGYPLRY